MGFPSFAKKTMAPFRLRSQLLFAALVIILGLTGSLLLFVRHTVNSEIQKSVRNGTETSVRTFETVQRERELQLSGTAAMLADLPPLKAQMPADALTIQDASAPFWKLARSDLFVLAKPNGRVVALHMTRPGWSSETVEQDLKRTVDLGKDASWWYHEGLLYWVFLHPVISGTGNTAIPLSLPLFLSATRRNCKGKFDPEACLRRPPQVSSPYRPITTPSPQSSSRVPLRHLCIVTC